MFDFDIARFTRRCHASGRELAAGETFYSVLVSEGAEVVRQDYAADAWTGPPEKTIGWWKSQVPQLNARKANLAPSEVMLQYFQELEGRPDKEDERYVLSLLMVRRRVLRQERTEQDAEGREIAVLYCSRNETEYRTPIVVPTPERAAAIQEELVRLLYSQADGSPTR
jgi:hypothetical protein